MARFQFVGPSYTSQSLTADAQLTKNWYVEAIESGQGKSAYVLYPTPGLTTKWTLPANVRRNGLLSINGRCFCVAGNMLYELLSGGTFNALGNVHTDGLPVSMAAAQLIAQSGTPQLAVISAGGLYVVNLLTNAFSTVSIGLAGTPFQIVYVDGYYFLLNTNGQWQVSNPLDATTWPGIETEATTSYSDQTVAIASTHRQFYTLSQRKGTTYYNAGDNPIPFDEVSGGDFEQGCGAPWSIVPLDNTLFFIGANKDGAGIAWRLSGYTPQRISNHAVEYAWQGYSTFTDAVCYGYQDQGHTFYVCYFPTANVTWVYDVATQMWHQREFWNPVTASHTAHRSCCHTYCFGMHIVGDWSSGNVYQMSITQTMDFGNVIKRTRRAPHISNENEWMFYQSLQIDMEVGLTPSQLLPGNGPPTYYVLADSSGALWNIGVNDTGALTSTPAAFANSQTLYLTDPTSATTWQITVNTLGVIQTTKVTLSTLYATNLLFFSSTGGSEWNVTVTTLGILQTQFVATVYRNPQINLRWSDDAAHTWSNYYPMDCGAPGNYKARVLRYRLGRARDRVFEITVTDPLPWRIVDAFLKATPGYVPTERLTDRARKMA
jgi:hypothetical protein